MKNRPLYQKIIKYPTNLEALQNTDILPQKYVPYSTALQIFERQEFHTFLQEHTFEKFRKKIDQERIFQNEAYLKRCNLDHALKEAEEKRQKARNIFNDALFRGYIKAVIFKFDENEFLNSVPNKIPKEFWASKKSFNIDGLSLYLIHRRTKIITEGLIALQRNTLEKWGKTYPDVPNIAGRKKGSGTIPDTERLEYMHTLIQENKASSINDAARRTVDKFGIIGKSSIEADIDRLSRKYSKKYNKNSSN